MANINKDKKKQLDALMGKINKKYGEKVILTGAQAQAEGRLTKRVIPTPSLELNKALYCGGFAHIVELFGPNSSGKTSIAIETIALAQKNDPNFYAAWLETEGSVTEEILASFGVDLNRIIFWRQEEVGNAENALDIARAILADGNIDMMVINSVAGLAPKTEVEDDLEKQNIALTARIMSKFFRVTNSDISKNDVVVVFINQLRDNVGVMYGDPSTTTGGKALRFFASQRIRMSKLKIQAKDAIKEEEGVKIGCGVQKNRFAGQNHPFTKCEYYARYGFGIDSLVCLPQFLADAGIVRQSGAWWYYEDEQGNLIQTGGSPGKYGSKAAFLEELRKNDQLREELTSKLSGNYVPERLSDEEVAEIEQQDKEIKEEMDQLEREAAIDDINDVLNNNS